MLYRINISVLTPHTTLTLYGLSSSKDGRLIISCWVGKGSSVNVDGKHLLLLGRVAETTIAGKSIKAETVKVFMVKEKVEIKRLWQGGGLGNN